MKTPIVDILLSIAVDISSINCDMANSVDFPGWNPYCFSDKILCFFKIHSNLLSKSHKFFENCDKTEIGL